MPISLSAKSSLRKSRKNYQVNLGIKSAVKTTIKQFLAKPSNDGLQNVYSVLDKAQKKGIFHLNKVARLKSEYSQIAKGKATKAEETAKKTAKKKMS